MKICPKKNLRQELEKKNGHKNNYDKMSKRKLISALTGVPKDKISKDEKDKKDKKEQAKSDDHQKKDGKDKAQAAKLTKQQVEAIWQAGPTSPKMLSHIRESTLISRPKNGGTNTGRRR